MCCYINTVGTLVMEHISDTVTAGWSGGGLASSGDEMHTSMFHVRTLNNITVLERQRYCHK